MTIFWLTLLLFTLVFSAFFSGIEIAFVSANKLEVDMAVKDESWKNSKFFDWLFKNPRYFLSVTLLGNNIALVLFGIAFSKLLDPLWLPYLPAQGFEMWLLLTNTIVSTIVILFAGEYIPKSLFRLNPMKPLRFFSGFFWVLYQILRIPALLTVWLSEVFFKLVTGYKPRPELTILNRFDLKSYIDERLSIATIEDEKGETLNIDAEMLGKVVEFESAKARECLVPRNEIDGVLLNATFADVKKKMVESGHSRLIVYEENIDNPKGYYFHQDVLRDELVMHPLDYYPESKSAWEILSSFIKEKKSLAIIVDEYGGTAGMVTLEDLIEEIFGEIKDEYDTHEEDELEEVIVEGKKYLFSARIEIDYLREQYDLRLPQSEEYETLGGLITNTLEYIPEVGETVDIGLYRMLVIAAIPARIEKVQLELI